MNIPEIVAERENNLTAPLFAASRLKLERARRFISELERETTTYKESNPATAKIVLLNGAPVINLEWAGAGLMPGAILGDAIHNMRTALDLMASELVRIKGQSDKNVYFPFASSKEALGPLIKKRQFDRAGEDAVQLLNAIAPYYGGNDDLRAIHDLDIRDKHTALILVGQSFSVQLEGNYNIDDPVQSQQLKLVLEDVFFQFPEGEEFAGIPILKVLKDLVQSVEGILESFQRLCLLRKR